MPIIEGSRGSGHGRRATGGRITNSRPRTRSSSSRSGRVTGSGPQDVLSQLRQSIMGNQAGLGGPSYLGGAPSDYRAFIAASPGAFRGGPAGIGHAGTVGPRYSKGEEWTMFQGKDPAYISRLQSQLITAGLLDPKHGSPGRWTTATAQAMEQIMGHANWAGQSWHGVLGDLVTAGEYASAQGLGDDPGFAGSPFIPRARLDPDPKVARQTVRDMIAQVVGEEYVTGGLLDKYTASLISDYHRQFNQEEKLRREQHEASQAIAESQYEFSIGEGEVVDERDLGISKNVKTIDPQANLRTALERRFRATNRGIQEHQKAQGIQTSLFGSMNSMINMGQGSGVQELG